MNLTAPLIRLAPAKTNLWLHVIGKRPDGFHEIETRMVALTLTDRLTFSANIDGSVSLTCSDPSLPTGEENLVVRAVRALEKAVGQTLPVSIHLEKYIPAGAGLGGGSSDAATVLLALNEMAALGLNPDELSAVGATIGSDIPFFLYERPCDVGGRGEVVVPVTGAVPPARLLLIKPAFGIAAAWAYRHFADSTELASFSYTPQSSPWGPLRNDLERPVFAKFLILGEMKSWLLQQPEVSVALMSGSGSTMLAVLRDEGDGESLQSRARERYGEQTWTALVKSLGQ
jgi:4-diphosphocytidyl-2-C-methyl-D-erythritol kinase